jgi:hypothetical protein
MTESTRLFLCPITPSLYNAWKAGDGSGVARELIQLVNQAIEIRFGRQPFGEDRVQNILHREWSDELYFAIECRWLHHVHLHSLNAGLEKRARQPRGRCLDRPLFAELFACRAR